MSLFNGKIDTRITEFVPCSNVIAAENVADSSFFIGRTWLQPREILTADDYRVFAANSSIVLDFGRELSGGVRIVSGKKAGRIRLRFGESVSEATGTPNQSHAIHDTELAVPAMGIVEYGNTGFRFVCIDALEDLQIVNVLAVARYRDIEKAGSFVSNDTLLNRIFDTAVHTVHMCMQDYILDGIKRDRLVWMGDMNPEINVINMIFSDTSIVPETMDFLRDRTPLPSMMNDISSYSLWWIICQWEYYLHQGNFNYLKEQHLYLKGLIELLLKYIEDNGRENMPDLRFIDWPTKEDDAAVHAGLQALLTMAFDAACKIAAALKDEDLFRTCSQALALLKKFPAPSTPRKSPNALLVAAGLSDAVEVNRNILSVNPEYDVSTFMSYYILNARCMANDLTGVLDLIRKYFGAMLNFGATTFWEDFDYEWTENSFGIDSLPVAGKNDIHADFGKFCYKSLRHSLCHGWAAGPAAILPRALANFKILEPGCRKISLAPVLADLEYYRCTIPTPHGIIEIETSKDAKKPEIKIPENIILV